MVSFLQLLRLPEPKRAGPAIPVGTGKAVDWLRGPGLWSQLFHQLTMGSPAKIRCPLSGSHSPQRQRGDRIRWFLGFLGSPT